MEADKSQVQQRANLLASRGQFDKAIAEWKKLLLDAPSDGAILNNIGDLHLKRNALGDAVEAYSQAGAAFHTSGSGLKAIAVYKKILKIDPTRYKIYQNLGDLNAERGLVNNAISDYTTLSKLYLKQGSTRDALVIYRKIVNLDPPNLDARRRLADLCLQEGLREEAVKTFLQLAKECSAQNRADEAREAYEQVLKIDPGNTSAERLLSNPHEAFSEDRPSKSAGSTELPGNLNRQQSLDDANRLMEAGQFSQSDSLLSELLSSHPGDPEVCRLLAMLHIKQGQLALAASEIQFLSEAAIRAEDYTLAESMVLEYLKADPKSVALIELLGSLYEQSGKTDKAAAQYGQALELLLEQPDPEMPARPAELYEKIIQLAPASPLVSRLASALSTAQDQHPMQSASSPTASADLKLSEPDEGQHTQSPVEDEVPSGAPAQPSRPFKEQEYQTHHELGLAYKDMGLLNEAIEEFRFARQSPDCMLESSSQLAVCLKEKNLLAAAIECLEQAVSDPRCAEDTAVAVRYELGRMYEDEGLLEKATAVFVTIPSFLDVPIRLERLRSPSEKTPSASQNAFETDAASQTAGEQTTVGAANTPATERKKRRISYL